MLPLVSRPVLVGGVAGAVAPFLFLLGAIGISWLEEDFMERLGWEVWPSGLALGPHGWLQTANFAVFGVLILLFALAVRALPPRNRWQRAAPVLVGVAGAAAVGLVFETDPPDVEETWHGLAHGLAYLTWLGAIVLAYPLVWWRVRGHPAWREAPRWPSALALLLFPPALLLPSDESSGNYLFFAAVLTPLAAIGIRLALGARRSLTGPP
jgi:MFS superfamily sulfate permease-like transporter